LGSNSRVVEGIRPDRKSQREDKNMSRIKSLLFLLALAAQGSLASATVTYVVGTCKNSNNTITSITQALQTTPRPNVVEVCPGYYVEQVVITFPVTVEGISDGSTPDVNIEPPSSGLVTTTTDSGIPIAAQVWVDNAGGEVNLTNLNVIGSGYLPSNAHYAGVLYQNTPGTMNHMVSVAHVGNGFGVGVWLQGGSATPSVTLENSFIAEADTAALAAETNSSTSELSVTIKGNSMNPGANNTETLYGIALFGGLTAAISDNLITGGPTAMWLESGSEGTISKNTIDGYNEDGAAIILKSDDMSVTGNTIEGNGEGVGIAVGSSVAPVTDNTIRFEDQGIDFVCIAGNNVHSNTIMGSNYGIIDVPASAVSANTYYSVGVSRQGGC